MHITNHCQTTEFQNWKSKLCKLLETIWHTSPFRRMTKTFNLELCRVLDLYWLARPFWGLNVHVHTWFLNATYVLTLSFPSKQWIGTVKMDAFVYTLRMVEKAMSEPLARNWTKKGVTVLRGGIMAGLVKFTICKQKQNNHHSWAWVEIGAPAGHYSFMCNVIINVTTDPSALELPM